MSILCFVHNLSDTLYDTIITLSRQAPICLCIGSDRVTGDCFGPLVGEHLKNLCRIETFVYGTLGLPVTALNLIETVNFIKRKHPFSPILAVDSALGDAREVGSIRVCNDGIYPGAATGKRLPKVGDFSITATVAPVGNISNLYGVQLGLVNRLAVQAANAISNCTKKLQTNLYSTFIYA